MILARRLILPLAIFCDGTRRYGVPGNENDESIECIKSVQKMQELAREDCFCDK